jgi:ParB family chromosome partitioning protein
MAQLKKRTRRKKVAPGTVGLAAGATKAALEGQLGSLAQTVEADGGSVLGSYLEPYGGKPVLLVTLPIDKVAPTPYQRDASEAHVKRLMNVIEKIGRFLDPVIAVHQDSGYWTPNGNHRLQALKKLGAKSVTALLLPDPELAFKILALNTEKAHNLREKSLEAIRMERALEGPSGQETDYAFELEEPAFLTLGICYEKRPRISGGAYHSLLRRIDEFVAAPVREALRERERRANKLMELDDAVSEVVQKLKDHGLTSPYLRAFVVARINPVRFSKATSFDFDQVLERMLAAVKKFNVEKIRQQDLASMAGPAPSEE